MSELPLPPDASHAGNRAPRLSLGHRLSSAFERTIRADGLFLLFLTMISLGMGFLCAAKWEKAEWKARATLRAATQTQDSGSGKGNGANLLVASVLNDLRNPEKLEAMNAALGQDRNAEEWEKEWKRAFIAMGDNASLQWTAYDKQTALQVVELVSQQVNSVAVALSKELHEKELVEWSNRIGKVESRLAELNKAQQELQKKNGITDVKGDLASLHDSITSLEYQLRLDYQAEAGAKEQYKEVLRQLDDAKRASATSIQREIDEKSQQVSEKELVKRRQILRDAIQAEKDQLEQKALIENKVNEKKQLEALAAQGKASPEGALRLETEIQVLKAKMAGNSKIVDMENELKMLDQTASPNPERKGKQQPTSQVIVSLLDKKMEMELKLLGLAQEKNHLQSELQANKSKRDSIQTTFEGKDGEYRQERERLIKEKGYLEIKRDQVATDGAEHALLVEWIQTPSVGEQPVSTNRYQLFSSVFLSCSLFGFLGVYAWELGKKPSTRL